MSSVRSGIDDAFELAPALAVEQAQFDFLGIGGKQGKIDPAAIPRRAERMLASPRDMRNLQLRNEEQGRQRRQRQDEFEFAAPIGSATTHPPLPTLLPP